MPFNISLETLQKTSLWTFKQNSLTQELQALVDSGDREGYVRRIKELATPEGGNHSFTRTKRVVYELFDEGEMIDVALKLQVKSSVITWYFIAPMDRTKQSFRDQVFNTASLAHANVANSCETYYRGTNHYHLKVMHTTAEESGFNHNHYRTANNTPVTPVEFYEHLVAFQALEQGSKFIPTTEERDTIILNYAVYWADYDLDINYVAFSMMTQEGQTKRIEWQLREIATTGKISPDEADAKLDAFFASKHANNMFHLAEKKGFPKAGPDREAVKDFIKDSYRKIYAVVAPKPALAVAEDVSLEPFNIDTHSHSSSSSATKKSSKSSLREEYESEKSNVLDAIDQAEYDAFADDLTKHCRSVDKQLLEHFQFEDYRQALLLYHGLRRIQKEIGVNLQGRQRIHPDALADRFIYKLLELLPGLQLGSTENDIGAPLFNQLIKWIVEAPPALEKWIDWIQSHGSRGLGDEIAHVRQPDNQVDLRQAVPMMQDRKEGEHAEIDFEAVNLGDLFLPHSNIPKNANPQEIREVLEGLNNELQRLSTNQVAANKLDSKEFMAKCNVIRAAIAVVSNKANVTTLDKAMKENPGWNKTSAPAFKSRIEECVHYIKRLAIDAAAELQQNQPKMQ